MRGYLCWLFNCNIGDILTQKVKGRMALKQRGIHIDTMMNV